MKRDAENKDEPAPFKTREYRQWNVAEFDGAFLARVEDWLIVTNNGDLGKKLIDNLLDGTKKNLSTNRDFAEAASYSREQDVWAYVDLNILRAAGVAPELFRGKAEDAGAELLLGGVLDILEDAPYATGGLSFDGKRLSSFVSVPVDTSKLDEAREYYFGPQGKGLAPASLKPQGTLANLIVYRDIGGWWLSKEDLFEENVIAELSQTDSELSTLFAGLDFGQEVLGALKPGVQFVVARQNHDASNAPEIKLPSFALVGRLKEPEEIQRRFKVAFQSVIGFVNINLAQQGKPQLELETERMADMTVTSATYLMDDQMEKGLIDYNFSPSIAFANGYMIVSSTRELAEELAELASHADPDATDSKHLAISVDGKMLSEVLQENRDPLVIQNMLEEGSDRETAEKEIDMALSLLQFVKQAQVDLTLDNGQLRLDSSIELNQP